MGLLNKTDCENIFGGQILSNYFMKNDNTLFDLYNFQKL